MRTTRQGDAEAEPHPDERDLRAEVRRRVGTLAFFGLLAAGVVFAVIAAGRESRPTGDPPSSLTPRSVAPGSSPLRAGTYRLPGLSTPVSITLPEGWFAGDSLWGPAGQGVAAVSTGLPGASVSIAALDLDHLHPFAVGAEEPRGRAGDRAWFRRWLEDYRSRVESRVRNRVMGRQVDWRPPPVLAWLLAHTDRGSIDVADDVVYDGRRGDLASFSFPGPRRLLFEVPGAGPIALRPGVTYTFWAPRPAGGTADALMLGVARELGAVPGTAEWEVVRTIELGG